MADKNLKPWQLFKDGVRIENDDVSPVDSTTPIGADMEDELRGVYEGTAKVSASPYAERLALWDAFSTGAQDTLDGILQFFWNPDPEPIYDEKGEYAGVKTDFTEEERKEIFYRESEIAERHKLLDLYKEQYGGQITAAEFGGMVADPSGVLFAPLSLVKKTDTVLKAAAKAMPMGTAMGASGYSREDGGGRLQNAVAGMFGSFVLTGGFKKAGDTWGEAIGEAYTKNVSEPIWKQMDSFTNWLRENDVISPICLSSFSV